MPHVEERDFTLRIELRVAFAEDYDGDDDGYAWTEELRPLYAELARVVAEAATRRAWRVRARNRGRSSDDEITLVLERGPKAEPKTETEPEA